MKCAHTVSGVLMIVGLGYLAGVGQALLRDRPVILGATTTTPTKAPPPQVEHPTPTDPPTSTPPASQAPDEQDPAVEFDARLDAPVPEGMLTLRQAHQMWIDGAYFIDSRHRYEYDLGHISGAAYLTAESFFTDEGAAEMQTIPPDATVIIYCLGGDECEASKNTLALLQQSFYTDLSIMGVGYDEWEAAGLPIGRSDDQEQSP